MFLAGVSADIAQLAEHPPCKREVTSSILVVGSTGHMLKIESTMMINNVIPSGGYPSGQRGLTVNQLSDDFGGSNPSPPTTEMTSVARHAHVAQSAEHVL